MDDDNELIMEENWWSGFNALHMDENLYDLESKLVSFFTLTENGKCM